LQAPQVVVVVVNCMGERTNIFGLPGDGKSDEHHCEQQPTEKKTATQFWFPLLPIVLRRVLADG